MIFDEVTIENFGVYAGAQSMTLSPPSADKPVILVGGLNGGGKTTFLDAIQLALYGKFAPCSNRGTLSYAEFLKRSINQGATERTAQLGLKFRHTSGGQQDVYFIQRIWSDNDGKVDETFSVEINGEKDDYLSENWTEAVERILPRRIANLFLFDGEKIESYASPEASQELVRSAIHSLLGIDIVEQLERDLSILSQKKAKGLIDNEMIEEIDNAQSEYDELLAKRRTSFAEIASMRTKSDQLHKKMEGLDLKFQQKGGNLFERQVQLETEHEELDQEIGIVEAKMRELATGSAPLILVTELIQGVIKQSHNELGAEENQQVIQVLKIRDAEIISLISDHAKNPSLLKTLSEYFTQDLERRRESLNVQSYIGMSRGALASTEFTINDEFSQVEHEVATLQNQYETLLKLKKRKQSELASVPAKETIQSIIDQRVTARNEYEGTQNSIEILQKELAVLDAGILRSRQSLANKMEKSISTDVAYEDDRKMIQYASRIQGTLISFRNEAIKGHLARIEGLILECFMSLHRKKLSISEIKIDPEDFSITLYRENGKIVMPERLSAGERQLLAVATLWGLAKASNRQLPTIIDTPLGRLDSQHRGNLVDLYFPKASHQVILLSTDEEITDNYLARLSPSIGSSYELVFDDSLGATEIVPGYFKLEQRHVH